MKAAIYARYSSDNQRTESIDAQIRALKEYAKNNEYSIVKVYTDEALSGTSDARPEFLKMINDSKLGLFQAVLVHKLDRFARNRYDSAFYRKELKKNGVCVISALEKFDDSPESIILESVIEGMNEYYSANLSREVKKGMKENALMCKHNGGKPPIGYDIDENKNYIINEYEATIVKKIFKMYLMGYGYNKILDSLKGLTTKKGKPFSKSALNTILKNEKYSGVYVFNKYKRVKINGKYRNVLNENITRVDGGVPSIISKTDFEKAKKKMEKNRQEFRNYTHKEEYLLSGVIKCSCGANMVGVTKYAGRNKTKYSTYECSARKRNKTCSQKGINKDYIEKKVIEDIQNEILDDIDKVSESIYDMINRSKDGIEGKILSLEQKLKDIDIQIENIVNAIAQGMFHESLKEKMSSLEAKKANIITMIKDIKMKDIPLELNTIKAYLATYSLSPDKPFEERKKVVKTFVNLIVIKDDKFDIDLIVTLQDGGEGN